MRGSRRAGPFRVFKDFLARRREKSANDIKILALYNFHQLAVHANLPSAAFSPQLASALERLSVLDLAGTLLSLVLIAGLAYSYSSLVGDSALVEVERGEKTLRLADVRGCPEVVAELAEIVHLIGNRDAYGRLGSFRVPQGFILHGPPGVGKTHIARAVAGETSCNFYLLNVADLASNIVGEGAQKLRKVFKDARANAPSIIFIDEVDAIGGRRHPDLPSYARQDLNQLLAELDGFHRGGQVYVFAATNRLDDLDRALLRPGRFDRVIHVPLPELEGRRDILEYHLGRLHRGHALDAQLLARRLLGLSGADIAGLVRLASLGSLRRGAARVEPADVDAALDRMSFGVASVRRLRALAPAQRRLIAVHQLGKAFPLLLGPQSNLQLYKASIVPGGRGLGHVHGHPREEKRGVFRSELLAQLDHLLGGRAAGECFLPSAEDVLASSADLHSATNLAFSYLLRFSMDEQRLFLADRPEALSDAKRCELEEAAHRLMRERVESVKRQLRRNAKAFTLLVDELVERETLSLPEISAFLQARGLVLQS